MASSFSNTSAFLTESDSDSQCAYGIVDDNLLEIPEIAKGVQEIESPEYLYGQTPQFILSTHPCEEDDRVRPPLPGWFPPSARVYLKVKSGVIISSKISLSEDATAASSEHAAFDQLLKDKKVIDIPSFWDVLGETSTSEQEGSIRRVSAWLDLMMGKASGFNPQ